MRVALVACLLWSGCALGTVTATGDLRGFALGHAKLERCGQGGVVGTPACTRIEGGALSNTFAELFSTLVAAAGAAYMAYLGNVGG